jgi:hypothetical protein
MLKKTIANMTALSPEKPRTEGCLASADQVVSWVEAGINAIYRRKDVRQALLTALQKDAIDTNKIILDADLPQEQERSVAFSGAVNLRRLLDTPSLREGSALVDRILDFIGGHYDGLDQVVDKFIYANVDDETAVGKAFASTLLRASGKVNIPIPSKLQGVKT